MQIKREYIIKITLDILLFLNKIFVNVKKLIYAYENKEILNYFVI